MTNSEPLENDNEFLESEVESETFDQGISGSERLEDEVLESETELEEEPTTTLEPPHGALDEWLTKTRYTYGKLSCGWYINKDNESVFFAKKKLKSSDPKKHFDHKIPPHQCHSIAPKQCT